MPTATIPAPHYCRALSSSCVCVCPCVCQHTSPCCPGPDAPFVNNYGVWVDEFEALGLAHTLEKTYADAECFFGEGRPVS